MIQHLANKTNDNTIRPSFQRRALVAIVAPAAASLLIAVLALAAFGTALQIKQEALSVHAVNLINIEQLRSAFEWKVAANRGFFLTRDPTFLEREQAARAEFTAAMGRIKQSLETPDELRLFEQIEQAEAEHQAAVDSVKEHRWADDIASTVRLFESAVLPKREALRLTIAALEREARELFEQANRRAAAAARRSLIIVGGMGGAGILVVGYLVFGMRRKLSEAYAREAGARVHAENAVQVRDEFIAIASHELKTPIAALMMQAQGMIRQLEKGEASLSGDSAKRWAAVSNRQLFRLSRLVDTLLDATRIERGQLDLALEAVDLVDIANETIEMLCGQYTPARCGLEVQPAGPVVVRADRARISQVLTNVLGNALKFGDDKPIDIVIAAEAAYAELRIRDYGVGIDKSQHAIIFERFERIADAGSVAGLGLGLYVSRKLIELHHGSIRVESERGKGAEFVIRLPRNGPGAGAP